MKKGIIIVLSLLIIIGLPIGVLVAAALNVAPLNAFNDTLSKLPVIGRFYEITFDIPYDLLDYNGALDYLDDVYDDLGYLVEYKNDTLHLYREIDTDNYRTIANSHGEEVDFFSEAYQGFLDGEAFLGRDYQIFELRQYTDEFGYEHRSGYVNPSVREDVILEVGTVYEIIDSFDGTETWTGYWYYDLNEEAWYFNNLFSRIEGKDKGNLNFTPERLESTIEDEIVKWVPEETEPIEEWMPEETQTEPTTTEEMVEEDGLYRPLLPKHISVLGEEYIVKSYKWDKPPVEETTVSSVQAVDPSLPIVSKGNETYKIVNLMEGKLGFNKEFSGNVTIIDYKSNIAKVLLDYPGYEIDFGIYDKATYSYEMIPKENIIYSKELPLDLEEFKKLSKEERTIEVKPMMINEAGDFVSIPSSIPVVMFIKFTQTLNRDEWYNAMVTLAMLMEEVNIEMKTFEIEQEVDKLFGDKEQITIERATAGISNRDVSSLIEVPHIKGGVHLQAFNSDDELTGRLTLNVGNVVDALNPAGYLYSDISLKEEAGKLEIIVEGETMTVQYELKNSVDELYYVYNNITWRVK